MLMTIFLFAPVNNITYSLLLAHTSISFLLCDKQTRFNLFSFFFTGFIYQAIQGATKERSLSRR